MFLLIRYFIPLIILIIIIIYIYNNKNLLYNKFLIYKNKIYKNKYITNIKNLGLQNIIENLNFFLNNIQTPLIHNLLNNNMLLFKIYKTLLYILNWIKEILIIIFKYKNKS